MVRLLKTCLSCIWNLVTFKRLGEVEAMRGITSPRAKKLTAVYMASLIVGGAAFLQLQTRGCLPQIIRTVWGARTTFWWRTSHVVHILLEVTARKRQDPLGHGGSKCWRRRERRRTNESTASLYVPPKQLL